MSNLSESHITEWLLMWYSEVEVVIPRVGGRGNSSYRNLSYRDIQVIDNDYWCDIPRSRDSLGSEVGASRHAEIHLSELSYHDIQVIDNDYWCDIPR